jgi:putative endonuclease
MSKAKAGIIIMLSPSQQFGRMGEALAVKHLKQNGYRIVDRNYRNRFGEIDIIAIHNDTIVFVEVKARSSSRFGTARYAVGLAKQKKISRVALGYLKQKRLTDKKARFDVVCVDSGSENTRVEIIANAFLPVST